jgi:2-methylcitrate dehydratase PrpD
VHEHRFAPDDVELIEHIGPSAPCTGALLRDDVRQGLEGKFCLRYNIAAAVIDRKVDLETFSDKRATQGDLQEFMRRVRLIHNPDVLLRHAHIADGNPEARLRVHLRNGRRYDVVLGPALHLTGDAVVDKFRGNASAVFDQEHLDQPIQLVQRLEELDDVTALMNTVTMGR